MILVLVAAMASCKKTPEVNLKYVDVERDLVTVGTTTANIQCDYEYIATLKKSYFCYGESETNMNSAEMRVVQNTLYVELVGLRENTTYSYYYEFHNDFNSMRTVLKTFKTESGNGGGNEPPTPEITLPTVITASVTEITTNSAKGGGEVTNDGGTEVTERGICWSTNANPTISNSHSSTGSGVGAFSATMGGLSANTTYHVRAYATNEAGTAYGLDKEFTTFSGGGGSGDHEYVDLGLPSGLLWATCNVGANSPEEYGDYFAWGEIQPKDYYDWITYQYCCNGNSYTLTKYCNDSYYGYNGFTDDLTTLLPEDDAATANWGFEWRMPTREEWQELYQNTTGTWTTQDGVNGRLFTASNGNSLFLPAAGRRLHGNLSYAGSSGQYWSSSLMDLPIDASYFGFNSVDYCDMSNIYRPFGYTVRPVRSASQN